MPSHHHRSGGLKQTNKRNKRSSASKRSIARVAGAGKVNAGGSGNNRVNPKLAAHTKGKAKADRNHQAQQRRAASRQLLVQNLRHSNNNNNSGNGSSTTTTVVPRLIGIVNLSSNTTTNISHLENAVQQFLIASADQTSALDNGRVMAKYNCHKKQGLLTFLTHSAGAKQHSSVNSATMDDTEHVNDEAHVAAALDLCRVCDMVLFCLNGDLAAPSATSTVEGNHDSHDGGGLTGMSIGGKSVTTSATTKTSDLDDRLVSERGDRILTAIKSQGLPTPLTLVVHSEASSAAGEDGASVWSMGSSIKSARRGALKRRMELKRYAHRFAIAEFGPDAKCLQVDLPDDNNNINETEGMMEEQEEDARSVRTGRSCKILPMSAMVHPSAALVRTLCTTAATPPKWISEMPRPFVLSDDAPQYNATTRELQLTGHVRGGNGIPLDVNGLFHIPGLGTFAAKSISKSTPPLASSSTSSRKSSSTKGTIDVELTDDAKDNTTIVADPLEREPLEMFASPDSLEGEQNLIGFEEADHPDFDDDDDVEGNAAKMFEKGQERPAGWSDYQSAWLDAMDPSDDVAQQALNEEEKLDHGELAFELNKKGLSSASTVGAMEEEEDFGVNPAERKALVEQRLKELKTERVFPDEVEIQEDVLASDRYARYRSLKSFRTSTWDPKENLPGSYGQIYHFDNFRYSLMMVAVGLLPHENKISVLHMGLSQTPKCDAALDLDSEPVKCKDVLTVRCGWRTWQCRPVFSQHNLNSDKHKLERFLPTGGAYFCASVLGPVTYAPCPVLMFRGSQLMATGTMLGADADRIVIKRIIMTGFPSRVHKRHCIVKHMFYNPEDVKWFKPAGLTTKHGLQGNIVQSVGDHGTMKCLFNAPIKQHDTVCLPLYKRMYPKFAPTETEDGNKSNLVVL
eukprot:scaffold17302_cov53-Attheya_sp.AAC.5